MKYLYSIFDSKADCFQSIFESINDFTATRDFLHAFTAEGPPVFREYPADFQLYRLGSYDQATGELERGMVHVIGGLDAMRVVRDREAIRAGVEADIAKADPAPSGTQARYEQLQDLERVGRPINEE